MKRFALFLSIALLFVSCACAAPVLSNEKYVAWIGETQHLHIQRLDGQGSMVLRSPVGNLVTLVGDVINLQTASGKLYRIHIDTNQSEKIQDEPSEEMLAFYANQSSIRTVGDQLFYCIGDEAKALGDDVIGAAVLREQIYAAHNEDGKTVITVRNNTAFDTIQEVAIIPMTCVGITVTEEAVTLLGDDGCIAVVNIETGERQMFPAPSIPVDAAAFCRE